MKPINLEKVKADAKRLFEAAEQLNKVSDEFNQSLASIENNLASFNLGIKAEFCINPEKVIGYGRIGDKWGIYVRDSNTTWPLQSAPRYLRIACIDYLPNLLEELLKETNLLSQVMMLKVSLAKDMVSGLPKVKEK